MNFGWELHVHTCSCEEAPPPSGVFTAATPAETSHPSVVRSLIYFQELKEVAYVETWEEKFTVAWEKQLQCVGEQGEGWRRFKGFKGTNL